MLNAMRITRRRVNEQIDDWTSSAGAKANTLAYEDMIDRAYKECDTDQVCSHALDAFRRQLLEENNRERAHHKSVSEEGVGLSACARTLMTWQL